MQFNYSSKVVLLKSKPKKNGTFPINLQVIINRKIWTIGLKLSVKEQQFFPDKQQKIKIKGEPKKSADYNLIIDNALAKATEIFIYFRLSYKVPSIRMFKESFLSDKFKCTFSGFIDTEIKKCKNDFAPGTIKNYRKFKRLLDRFRTDVSFSELDGNFAIDFDRYLRRKYKHNYVVSMKKICKKFVLLAIRRGIKIKDPFTNIGGYTRGSKEALTKEELLSLYNLYKYGHLTNSQRDVLYNFLGSAFNGGIRFQDIEVLTRNEIVDGMIIFIPKKTKRFNRIVKINISTVGAEFIDTSRQKLFRTISNCKTNETLKLLGTRVGISKSMSFHMARHTFATLFLELGGSPEVCMEIMGISDWKTIKVYMHIANSRKREQMANMDKIIPELAPQSPVTVQTAHQCPV